MPFKKRLFICLQGIILMIFLSGQGHPPSVFAFTASDSPMGLEVPEGYSTQDLPPEKPEYHPAKPLGYGQLRSDTYLDVTIYLSGKPYELRDGILQKKAAGKGSGKVTNLQDIREEVFIDSVAFGQQYSWDLKGDGVLSYFDTNQDGIPDFGDETRDGQITMDDYNAILSRYRIMLTRLSEMLTSGRISIPEATLELEKIEKNIEATIQIFQNPSTFLDSREGVLDHKLIRDMQVLLESLQKTVNRPMMVPYPAP